MKRLSLLIITLLVFTMGCSNSATSKDTETVTTENVPTEVTETPKNDDGEIAVEDNNYYVLYNDVEIRMHEAVAPILEKLGEADHYFEAESCAFQGLDRIYTYGGVEIHTYELENKDYVASVLFLDDSVATVEGIYLFSNIDKVLETYGDTYNEDLGLYVYTGKNSKISFLVEEGEVTSLEYNALVEE